MTRILFSIALTAAWACAQQSAPSKPAPAKKTGGAAASKKEDAALPAGAILVSEGTWRYTDAEGKTWTYRRTPFGLIKMEGAPQPSAESGANLRVVGVTADEVEFESVTPFAKPRWKRAKSALSPEERSALQRHVAASNSQPKENK